MAVPTIRGVTDTGSATAVEPAGATAGDADIVWAINTFTAVPTLPAGWTSLLTPSGGSYRGLGAWIDRGSGAPALTFTNANRTGLWCIESGTYDAGTGVTGSGAGNPSGKVTSLSISPPSSPGADDLVLLGVQLDTPQGSNLAAPTGFTVDFTTTLHMLCHGAGSSVGAGPYTISFATAANIIAGVFLVPKALPSAGGALPLLGVG